LAWYLLFAVYTAIQLLGKFPRRTLADVTPYLRPAELEEIQDLLDPAKEVNFPPASFPGGVSALAA